MAVLSKVIKVWVCTCDKCGKSQEVAPSDELYNGAAAVRSIGWKFGKDRSVKCAECRSRDWDDHYQYIAAYKQENKNRDVAE